MNSFAAVVCLLLTLWPLPQTPPANPPASPPPVAPSPDKVGATQPSSKTEPPKTVLPETVPLEPKIMVSPNPCLPGQSVTFVLPPGVKQGTVSGGKFTHPTEIDSLPALTDTPTKTTTYRFALHLPTDAKADTGKAESNAKHTKASAKTAPLKTQQEAITVQVYDGKFAPLATYRDPRGWHIDLVRGWNRNVVPQQDPANHTLIFFQPQEDSSTRLAVSINPVSGMSCTELTSKVIDDIPTEYDIIKEITKKETTQFGLPAMWVTFQGVDRALPNVPTRSVVLAFVQEGKGYVISGRSQAGEFSQWEKTLRCLVRSFTIDGNGKEPLPDSPAGNPKGADGSPAPAMPK